MSEKRVQTIEEAIADFENSFSAACRQEEVAWSSVPFGGFFIRWSKDWLRRKLAARDQAWEAKLAEATEVSDDLQDVFEEISKKATYGAYGVHHILYADFQAIARKHNIELL